MPPCDERWIDDPAHPHVLNEAQWRRLFAEAGFTVVRADTGSGQRYLLRRDRAVVDVTRVNPD